MSILPYETDSESVATICHLVVFCRSEDSLHGMFGPWAWWSRSLARLGELLGCCRHRRRRCRLPALPQPLWRFLWSQGEQISMDSIHLYGPKPSRYPRILYFYASNLGRFWNTLLKLMSLCVLWNVKIVMSPTSNNDQIITNIHLILEIKWGDTQISFCARF